MFVEAAIDFPDEEIDFLQDNNIEKQANEILANIAVKICMNAENQDQAKANGKLFGLPEKALLNLKPGQGYIKANDSQTELKVRPSWER